MPKLIEIGIAPLVIIFIPIEFDNDDAARPAVLAIGIPEAAIVAPR